MSNGKTKKIKEANRLTKLGYTQEQIAKKLRLCRQTVSSYLKNNNLPSSLEKLHNRFQQILDIENPSDKQLKLLDKISIIISKLEKVQNTKNKQYKKNTINDISHIDPSDILVKMKSFFKEYQLSWIPTIKYRNRVNLKARQSGFTHYFSIEALYRACLYEKNIVFCSASERQVMNFAKYIKSFVRKHFSIELKGTKEIKLITKAGNVDLIFLATNASTAQSFHGDLYIDEFCWIPNFTKFKSAVTGQATHKQYTITYFSTASTIDHDAWSVWKPKRFKKSFPSNEELKKGLVCDNMDGFYRKLVDINTILKQGCDFIDKNQLQKENSKDEYEQKYCCIPLDSQTSIFNTSALLNCTLDSSLWQDFNINKPTDYKGSVVIGIDPAFEKDFTEIVILAIPTKQYSFYRVIEKVSLKNCPYERQKQIILSLLKSYNTKDAIIDGTTLGLGLAKEIQKHHSSLIIYKANNENKNNLLSTSKILIEQKKVFWDSSYNDITQGFLSIKYNLTKSGLKTYTMPRNKDIGHADATSALMLALSVKTKLYTQENFNQNRENNLLITN